MAVIFLNAFSSIEKRIFVESLRIDEEIEGCSIPLSGNTDDSAEFCNVTSRPMKLSNVFMEYPEYKDLFGRLDLTDRENTN